MVTLIAIDNEQSLLLGESFAEAKKNEEKK